VDKLDYYGFTALQQQHLHLVDADEPIERARQIKTMDEIELMRQSAAVCEAALYDLEQAIRPGVSENELLGVYWHKLCSLGGEYVFCRLLLLASGYKTNPWFHEAGSKLVRPGDLVGFDTDTIGPEGYACDISRKAIMPEGKFKENIVVSVECYAGKVGEQDVVKLEDEVWITADGPVIISLYPYEDKLLS
jgi:Xaa-Pro aminopeptidase